MPLRIALDLDDVLVDFDHPFAQLLENQHDVDIPKPEGFPDHYHWYQDHVTPEQLAETWKWIDANPEWWTTMPPTLDAITCVVDGTLPQLCHDAEIFLVTTRPQSAKGASEYWFGELTGLYAGVITTKSKGELVAALCVDAMFDDVLHHLQDAQPLVGGGTKLFLVTTNHNLQDVPPAGIQRVSLAAGVAELLL